jgi:cytochrome d ubiquinol oxidase subunit I
VAGVLGSIMVISVNGWMNHPRGFRLVDGRVTDVDPWRALFGNSYFWHQLVHMYLAGYMATGFLVAGAYALGKLRGRVGRLQADRTRGAADRRRGGLAGTGARR